MNKRTNGLAWLATALLVTTGGCSALPDSDAKSPAGDGGDRPGHAVPHTADPASVVGLRIVRDGSEDSDCRWATSYPAVPGADPLSAALKADIDNRMGTSSDGTTDAAGAGCVPVNISYDLLVASGDVVGVRLSTLDYGAAGDGTGTRAYWYDGKTGKTRKPTALIDEDSFDAFVDALKDGLKGREGVSTSDLDSTFEDYPDTLDDFFFTDNGDLVAEFDRGQVGVPTGGRQQAVIPAEEATSLLSDFGRRVQRQTTDPSGELALGVDPEPLPLPKAPPPADSDVDCAQAKCVALTFDDGPGPDTARLLDTLSAGDAHATFFVVGQNAAAHPDLLRAMADAGHEIGNHSWNHADLTQPDVSVSDQISRTNAAIKAATGAGPTLMRPPYGALNDQVKKAAGLPIVLWNVDTLDWKNRDSAKVADAALGAVEAGDIVLMHDIHATSVDAVPSILNTLTSQGFHFVTVSRLLADRKLTPGTTYTSR
ncbi:polysaccharide deacetylase family protein [Streptomyces sp. NPDC002643]